MNEFYKEILVKRKSKPVDMLKKVGLILLTALLAFVGLAIPPVMIAAIAAGVLSWYVITGLNQEFEYLYVNGDLDVDRIMNKQRRKRVGSYTLETMELIAPTASHDLDPYTGREAKVYDYTSGEEQARSYTAVYMQDAKIMLVRLELEADVIEDIRRRAPRKVSRELLLTRR